MSNLQSLLKLRLQAFGRIAAAILCAALVATAPAAHAGVVPFSATMAGVSDIVEVLDPNGPVVRVQTLTSGAASLGLTGYHSTDIVSLATGVGSGTNVFFNDDGDELFGSFTVQLVPTDDPSVLALFGEMLFIGGTGPFAGASGNASFNGLGQFTSATHADSRFTFSGLLNVVPEPASFLLLAIGMGALWVRSRRPHPATGMSAL
jgi:hypothetical protein